MSRIEQHGFMRFEHVAMDWDSYYDQKKEFYQEFKLFLPTWSQLPSFGQLKDLRLCCKPLTLTRVCENSRWNQIKFLEGYLTDGGSSPDFMRCLVDNDATDELKVWLRHDYAFSTHYISFRQANKEMYQGLRSIGKSRFKSAICWIGVSSREGKRRWKESLKRKEWTLKTTEIMEAR